MPLSPRFAAGVCLLLLWAALAPAAHADTSLPLQINEVMGSNDGFLKDGDDDSPDWIEIRNPNTTDVPLSGYRLADESNVWIFPEQTLPAGQVLLVFASGKDRRVPGAPLHTSFSIRGEGELLQLLTPEGTVTDSVPASVPYPDNVSYGRATGGGAFGYFRTPTPGAANGALNAVGPMISNVTNLLNRVPLRPGLVAPASLADSIAQFSGVQGQNGWTFGYYIGALTGYNATTMANFVPFTAAEYKTASYLGYGPRWENASNNPRIGADFTMPRGGTATTLRCAVRRWTSTFAGPVVMEGFFHNIGTAGGDGTRWQIFLNGTPLLSTPTVVLTALRRFSFSATLAVGDQVDIVCDPGSASSDAGDASRFGLRIHEPVAANPAVHDAFLPVSARLLPTVDAIQNVSLRWKIGYAAESSLPMNDSGTDGDLVAGDNEWTARIPLETVHGGELLRWRVLALDIGSRSTTSPSYLDTRDSPQYEGTVALDTNLDSQTRLKTLSLFIQNPALADTAGGTRASLFWDGVLYDNVDINLHAASSDGYAKKSYDVDFNRGRRFYFTPTGHGHTDINLLTNWRDRSKMRNPMSYDIFRQSGQPTIPCDPVRMEMNGVFHSIADLTGEANEGYLEDNGLDPSGALYKIQNNLNGVDDATAGVEKKTRKTEANTDLRNLITGVIQTNAAARDKFIADNLDISGMVNFIAAMTTATSDDWGHKNYFIYRDTNGTGLWIPLPWDLDLSFGHYYGGAGYFDDALLRMTSTKSEVFSTTYGPNGVFRRFYEDSTLLQMQLRRTRTLLDTYFQPATVPLAERYMERKMDERLAVLDPPSVTESDAAQDLRIWGFWNQHNSSIVSRSAAQEVARLKTTWLGQQRSVFFSNSPALDGGPIPSAPLANPEIRFGSYDSNPESGNQDHEYLEIVNNSVAYVDLSGWTISGGVSFTFPPGTVITPAGNVLFKGSLIVAKSGNFRSRTVSPKMGETRQVVFSYKGQLSNRSETLELRNTAGQLADTLVTTAHPDALQDHLRITEINYNPAAITPAEAAASNLIGTQDFEFLELLNTSAAPLDISGCYLDEGISFTVPATTILPAGGRAVIAKNPAAFAIRYGNPGVPVLGPYPDNLSNSGEKLTLREPDGEVILSFSYSDSWFKQGSDPTDGNGRTLVVSDAAQDWTRWDDSGFWRMSGKLNGDPGLVTAPTGFAWNYEAWRRANYSSDERLNESISGPLGNASNGLSNLSAYVLGVGRYAPAPELHPRLVTDAGKVWPVLSCPLRPGLLDATCAVEAALSPDGPWTIPTEPYSNPGSGSDPGVLSRSTLSVTDQPRQFLRLKMTRTP